MGRFCCQHKQPHMINVVSRTCAFIFGNGTSCPVLSHQNQMCARHDTSQKRIRKSREMTVVDHLLHNGLRHNQQEKVECSNVSQKWYFPDITWDCGMYIKHLEIDEQQHKSYLCECKRIMELAQSRFEVATLLIRYNPDTMHVDGTNWRWNKKSRLQLLVRTLEWADTKEARKQACEAWQRGQVLVIYLFYDDKYCCDEKGKWPGQVCFLQVDSVNDKETSYSEVQHYISSLTSL